MSPYYILRQQYQYYWQQLKCVAVFCMLLLPLLASALLLQSYSALLFQALLLLAGWLTWTFAEYILHRFWMHRKAAAAASQMVQSHNHHHSHPTEIKVTATQRLLMLALLVLLSAISYYLQNYFTFFTGFCFGVVGYYTMHKIIHQAWAARVFPRLFRYHIYHHCKYPNSCFGISVPWWDDVFHSVPKNPQITDRIVAFYLGGHH
ncbi:MAG: sterol desaturase family protein [Chitinophagaceae bacterium]